MSQTYSAVLAAEGKNEEAKEIQEGFLNDRVEIAESLPVLGHAIAAGYAIAGDSDEAEEIALGATKSTVVALGGAAGIACGPAAPACGAALELQLKAMTVALRLKEEEQREVERILGKKKAKEFAEKNYQDRIEDFQRIQYEEERRMDQKAGLKDRAPSMYDGLDMESELECPICFELARPPIFQCPEGHILCGSCRPRVTRCPVCRFVFKGPDIRNRFIEKMSDYYFSF